MSNQATVHGGPRVLIQEPITGIEVLSTELQEKILHKIKYHEDNNKPLKFGRIGRNEVYPQSNPPQPRMTAKTYVQGEFKIVDPFDKRRKQKVMVNNDGANRLAFSFDDAGILEVRPDQLVLAAGLLTDSRNINYNDRDKTVHGEWEEIKEKQISNRTDLTRERTEHLMVDVVFKMKGKEILEFAEEIVKADASLLLIGNRSMEDIRKDIIRLVKTSPLFYAGIIPSEETKVAVLVNQAVQLDVLRYNEATQKWGFVKKDVQDTYKEGFAEVGAVSDPVETMVKFLLDKKNATIYKKVDTFVNPKFDLWD